MWDAPIYFGEPTLGLWILGLGIVSISSGLSLLVLIFVFEMEIYWVQGFKDLAMIVGGGALFFAAIAFYVGIFISWVRDYAARLTQNLNVIVWGPMICIHLPIMLCLAYVATRMEGSQNVLLETFKYLVFSFLPLHSMVYLQLRFLPEIRRRMRNYRERQHLRQS